MVEGAVRSVEGRHRIFARLLSVEEEKQIWSERYDERCESLSMFSIAVRQEWP